MTSSRVENSSSRAARKVKLALMGPAFVAAIGYIDPGNFATNIQAGASFGYQLLWVVVWANLMAMLIQVLSAKLGIATGKNLAEQIRDHYPRPVVWFYWVQAEIIAMATDLAEFIGAAIGWWPGAASAFTMVFLVRRRGRSTRWLLSCCADTTWRNRRPTPKY